MADSAADKLHRYQNRGRTNIISISITQRKKSDLFYLQEIWDFFDRFEPIVCYYVFFTQKSSTPSDSGKCLSRTYRHHWISVIFEKYDKNAPTYVFTVSLPIEYFPAEQKVLPSVMSPNTKPDGKDIYTFQPHHCANVSNQICVCDLT